MNNQSTGHQSAQNIPFVVYLTADQVDALRILAAAAGKTETQLAAGMIEDGLHPTPKPRPTQATIDRIADEIKRVSYAIHACNRVSEALRSHANDEVDMLYSIDELANGYIIGGLSSAIGVLSRTITAEVEILGGEA